MLQAIIFDFDGLIADTESSILQSWQEVYADHNLELDVDEWRKCVGAGYNPDTFDPVTDLEARANGNLDWPAIKEKRHAREMAIVENVPMLPGIAALLDDAKANGIKLAVGSSSPHEWVDYHLERLNITDYFNVVICSDDVAQIKPAPDLFQKAAVSLDVEPAHAVVLEDSAHGVTAARGAGIKAVAIPNEVTRHLDFRGAMMRVNSCAELSVDLLDRALINSR